MSSTRPPNGNSIRASEARGEIAECKPDREAGWAKCGLRCYQARTLVSPIIRASAK